MTQCTKLAIYLLQKFSLVTEIKSYSKIFRKRFTLFYKVNTLFQLQWQLLCRFLTNVSFWMSWQKFSTYSPPALISRIRVPFFNGFHIISWRIAEWIAKTYPKPSQISKMELFPKIVKNGFQPFTIFAENSPSSKNWLSTKCF